ncbi:HPP family protein [Delftia sp. PS-11]|uniref:HPP family protein n=1 Tax=Delftia sp. PS-11 TaxID=2767222 RepID=UPI0024556C5A|nr:HPP family protein [Delftia sp. PS-11]
MIKTFREKIGGTTASPPRAPLMRIAAAFVGGAAGIGLLAFLTDAYGAALLMAPFGATCVLLFAVPDSPLAQPRNVIGGHVVATAVGLIATRLSPSISPAEMGIVVGLAIAAMQLVRAVHPPAGADPIVVMMLGPTVPWSFLVLPALAGAVILVMIALVVNNVERGSRWPKYWL